MRSQDICGTQRESQTMHNLWVRLLFQSFLGCRLLHPQFKRRTAVGYVVPKNPLKGHSTCREALSICMNQPKMQPTGKWKRKRDLTSPAPLSLFHSQSLSLFRLRGTYGRYVLRMSDRILRRSKSWRRCSRDHYSASQPVEFGRFRIAIYQKSSRPLYKVIYFLYLQLRIQHIPLYLYIYLYYKS